MTFEPLKRHYLKGTPMKHSLFYVSELFLRICFDLFDVFVCVFNAFAGSLLASLSLCDYVNSDDLVEACGAAK